MTESFLHLMEVEKAIAHLRLNPQPQDESLEELRQEYETVLGLLESEFLGALISGNWTEFDQFVNDFKTQCTSTQTTTTTEVVDDEDCLNDPIAMILEITRCSKASADELDTRSAGPSQTTDSKPIARN